MIICIIFCVKLNSNNFGSINQRLLQTIKVSVGFDVSFPLKKIVSRIPDEVWGNVFQLVVNKSLLVQ